MGLRPKNNRKVITGMPAGGGLLQLVANGKQDVFLTGNPQISFFKMVYRRYTNFAIESQPMYFDGTANFGQRISCLIPRRGDLLGRIYIDVQLPQLFDASFGNPVSYVNSIGNALIQEITFEVGEQEIDRQTGQWMYIWQQLTTPTSQQDALYAMIGQQTVADGVPPTIQPPPFQSNLQLHIPLQFYFCRNPGLYLPLIALQYHPIRINITLAPLNTLFYNPQAITSPKCTNNSFLQPASITSMLLWGDYVYLDVEERRRFVAKSHEYLIEQVQYTPLMSVTPFQSQINIQTDFNHPIKEFIFICQRDIMSQVNEPFNFSSLAIGENPDIVAMTCGCDCTSYSYNYNNNGGDDLTNPPRTDLISQAILQLDGYDRFQVRNAMYFSTVQPYEHHTTTPVGQFIYCYSMALRPEDAQPSGTLNASRIDSVNWQITMNPMLNAPSTANSNTSIRGPATIRIFAINYNVFRVVNGFGGVLFTI